MWKDEQKPYKSQGDQMFDYWDIGLYENMCWPSAFIAVLTCIISKYKSDQRRFCNNLIQVFVFFTIIKFILISCFVSKKYHWLNLAVKTLHWMLRSNPYGLLKVGDKNLINSLICLHEVPAKLNFEGKTSEVLLSSQAHFVMCLG